MESYGAMMALHVPYMFFPALIIVCLGRGIVLYMNEHDLLQRLFGERSVLAGPEASPAGLTRLQSPK
jgi:hypothetical protein